MVKSGKLRSGTAQKLRRWKKGHSSDSNPESRRHREAAKSRFFSPAVKSGLTVDALKLHNELQSDQLAHTENKDGEASPMDETGQTERTTGTFLSGLSDCSNITFQKVQRFWESNSASHKEICAVLAAVTDVIRSQGGKETETEYFAALMTTLEVVDSGESMAAVAFLLNLVLKRVPSSVLIKKFSDTSKVFMNIMSSNASLESPLGLRLILSCLSTLLKKQNASVWSYASTLQVYHGLLSFTVHSKPKVRKMAQQGVCSVLKGGDLMFGDSPPSHHPAAQSTAKFCIKEMERAGKSQENTTTLHIMELLKELLPCFPVSSVKSCCEMLLRVMTLNNVLVTAGAMQTFHRLFSAKPKPSTLSSELNAQIITALYDYLPSENDLQPMLAWLTVMEKAHIHLSSIQNNLCLGHLPRLFSTAMNCFLSPHTDVVSTAAQILKTLLKECVSSYMEETDTITPSSASGSSAYIYKMFRQVEEGLTYRFHSSWCYVLHVLSVFYQVAGKKANAIMLKSLQSLCDLRATPRFPFSGELDQAVGSAVESMGPEIVLKAIPLQITDTEDLEFPRSWLIPVIRDHVKNTELGFFTRYFLPLTTTLKSKADEFSAAGQMLQSKVYNTLQMQIWTLLPGFCLYPTDLTTSFKGIARVLGMALNERPDLRPIVCQAIRTLIKKSCDKEESQAEVGRFAKNFLPILFNVYTKNPEDGDCPTMRMCVLDTIKVYLAVTEQQMICSFLQKASEKLSEAENTEFQRLAVMDLIAAMAPFVDEPSLSNAFHLVKPYLESKQSNCQKKAYRVLEEISGGETLSCQSFIKTNFDVLKQTLLESLKSASSPSKRPRLKCLAHIVRHLNQEHSDFIKALLPEVIVCTKEVSVGARQSAYMLLVEIGKAYMRFHSNAKDALNNYLEMIYIGLTGSVTMISCTILALTRLVYEFKDFMEISVVEQLLENVCLLLASKTREVVKAALSFIKVILFVLDIKILTSHVSVLMEGLGSIKDDIRWNLRTKLKNIFTKLIRKFGFDLVKSMLPVQCHKVLINIRKAEARNKKRKMLKKMAESDSEEETTKNKSNSIEDILAESDPEDEEEGKNARASKKHSRHKGQAWLKEGEGDEPLNFLDPKVSQRVLATNPDVKKTPKASHGFKVASDGRLIISNDDDEEKKSEGKQEGMNDVLEEVGVKSKKKLKRKFQEGSFDDDMEVESQNKYKAGGSGIHRKVSKVDGFGGDYKSKKGKGDVKKKGKHDPYAYVPLKKTQLNRRKRAKLQGQFKGLIRGAQKGAKTGKKMQKKRKV
ncbi:RRP12-like protein [Erpetoichthys calabaricus]|uniref:RRP12-like protein n=1 Tax=Erpetoichthys calabaricus TaxID=27687 RepID=UPI00109F9C07|nr:RRP12-like protein [Erpetoichthys calabaricus]